MKTILFLMLLFNIYNSNGQIGTPIEPSRPDTVYIQYLAKQSFEVNESLATVMSSDLTNYFNQFEYIFFIKEDKIIYIVKCWTPLYLEIHEIIQSHYSDAYFIDKMGWRVNLGSLKN